MIPTVTVSADSNPECDTPSGKNTKDKVFLLSIPEVKQYMNSIEARKCEPTAYALAQGAGTRDDETALSCWWWLRSPGVHASHASCILEDTSETYAGEMNCFGFSVNDFGAIRPVMWIESAS